MKESDIQFTEVWTNSPADGHDQDLEIGDDGSFRIVEGGVEEDLPDAAHAVEFILRACIIDKRHWPRFAAFMPTLYPPEQLLNIRSEFTGDAAAAIIATATQQEQSIDELMREAVCSHVCCLLMDKQIDEAPAMAAAFGMENWPNHNTPSGEEAD